MLTDLALLLFLLYIMSTMVTDIYFSFLDKHDERKCRLRDVEERGGRNE